MHFNTSPGRADFSPNLNNSKGVNEGPEVQKKYVWGQAEQPFPSSSPNLGNKPRSPKRGRARVSVLHVSGTGVLRLACQRALGLLIHRDRERRCCRSGADRGCGAPGAKAPLHHTVSPAQGGNSNSCYQFQTTFQRPGTMLNAFVA